MEASSVAQPVLELSASATEEIKALLTKPENSGKRLRVFVEEGGCSGMKYSLTFDEERPGDLLAGSSEAAVVVDPFSAQYLRGATVDFSDSLTGGGFKITNPNARQSCGCGKSFTA